MKIYSPTTEYTVVARLDGSGHRLVVRDEQERQKLIVVLSQAKDIRIAAPLLQEYTNKVAFSDFIEFFPHAGRLLAVFDYPVHHHDMRLGQALNDAPWEMRAAALRSLFAKVLSQEHPWEVLSSTIGGGGVFCTATGEIKFSYHLGLMPAYSPDCKNQALAHLSDTVRDICAGASFSELDNLYAALAGRSEPELDELYALALAASRRLSGFAPEPVAQKRSLRELFEAVKENVAARIETATAYIMFAAGIAALAITFYYTVLAPAPVDNAIKAIGTAVIVSEDE